MATKDSKNQISKKKISEPKEQKPIPDISRIGTKELLWLSAILTATFIFYFPTLKNNFVDWDDNIYILNNPFIFSLGIKNIADIFTSFFMANYHPLTMLSYAMEYAVTGESPFLYHFTNVIFHLLNTTLVFIFVRKLFLMLDRPILKNANLYIPVISALLFGLHPLHVESVSWVSERKDVLYTFFFLLASIKYLQFVSSKSKLHYTVTLLLFLLSILSKGMAVSFSVTIVAIDFVLKRDLFSKKVLIEKIPFFILSIFFGIIAILAQKSGDAIIKEVNFSLLDKISFASYALVQYVFKLLAPFNLVHFYPYPYQIDGKFPGYFYYFPAILMSGSAIIYYLIRRSRILIFGSLFFILNIFLVLRLLPIGDTIMADRYTYLSSIGIFIAIAFLINQLITTFPQFRKLSISVVVVYAAFLGYQTYQRTMVWRDSYTLWDDANKKYPNNSVITLNRGIALEKRGNVDEALKEYYRSVKLDPNNDASYTNIGNLILGSGDKSGAIEEYSKAISVNPLNKKAINNRGKVLIDIGKINESLTDFNKAIEIDPAYANAYHNRGIAKFYLKNYDEAIADFKNVIRLNPKHALAYFMMGLCYVNENNKGNACTNFQNAYDLDLKEAGEYLKKYCQ